MVEVFIEREQYRALECMNPDTPTFPPLRKGEIDRQFNPEGWKRKQLANNLMYATWMLKRKPLSTEDIEDFGAWKWDLKKAWSMMYLSGEKHWAT